MQERKTAVDHYQYVVTLTAALYRVTDLLPAQEPLRMHLRRYADEILAAYSEEVQEAAPGGERKLFSKISTIIGFLSVAHGLRNPAPVNFAVLSREYEAFAEALRKEGSKKFAPEKMPQPVIKPENGRRILHTEPSLPSLPVKPDGARAGRNAGTEMSDRQRAILDRVREIGKVKVSDFYEAFRGISAKTVQRDLQELVARNLLRKEGEKRWTIYMPNVS